MSKRGLFLDMDGTLADSLAGMRAVYHELLKGFGAVGSEAEFQSLNGKPSRLVIETLCSTHKFPITVDVLLTRWLAMVKAEQARSSPADGAIDVLTKAKSNGWVMAVVTSNPHQPTLDWLNDNNLSHFFTAVVGGDDTPKGKPNPDPYLHAVQLTGCSAEISLALEDSVQGALAASLAGLPTWVLAASIPSPLVSQPNIRGCLPEFKAIGKLLG